MWSPERMNGANAGTYPSTTGGMTSGRTMPRVFNRSSMADMSCLLLGLLHDEKESIDIFGMWQAKPRVRRGAVVGNVGGHEQTAASRNRRAEARGGSLPDS